MSKVVYYNGEDFENEVLDKNGITLVDFFAEWCGPCKMLAPVLDELSEKVDYKIVKVDTDKYSSLPSQYKIRSLPTMIVFKNGEPVGNIVGFVEGSEIEKKVKEFTSKAENSSMKNEDSNENSNEKVSFFNKIFGKK